jgi:hypothetical protein
LQDVLARTVVERSRDNPILEREPDHPKPGAQSRQSDTWSAVEGQTRAWQKLCFYTEFESLNIFQDLL